MTIQDFYKEAGGVYEDVEAQMMGEARVRKYIKKFYENPTFSRLEEDMKNKDYGNAFLEAHNMKGMSMNVGLPRLAKVSSDLTEALRNGPKGDVEGLFEAVREEYEKIIGLMKAIEE